MNVPIILPLDACTDRALVGGKAAALARLLADGAPVPRGICLSTEAARCFYRDLHLDASAVWDRIRSIDGDARTAILAECRTRILHGRWPDNLRLALEQAIAAQPRSAEQRWAVRSSATNEDEHRASFAGQYDTVLGVAAEALMTAVQTVWASLWNERVVDYQRRIGWSPRPPEMAVVIQPVLKAKAAGVLYTLHPVTGRADQLVVNAIPGLAPDLVDGHVTPDQFVLGWDTTTDRVTVQERIVGAKSSRTDVGTDGLVERPLSPAEQHSACVSDDELLALANVAKRIERAQARPLDIEWAIDEAGLWLLQARPVTVTAAANSAPAEPCEWSRTNFKETMPEVPSPLGLSFLEQFMDLFLMGPYRKLGCRIPPGLSSVKVYHGRPYLNVSLMHALIEQLRGDPASLAEHMGGHPVARPFRVVPLGTWKMLRAGLLVSHWIGQAARRADRWFADMRQMAIDHRREIVRSCSLAEVQTRIEGLNAQFLAREMTFGIAGGVTQCLQALGYMLPRWLGEDWRGLLNAAMQGQAQAISAQQIIRLAELVDIARRDPAVRGLFEAEPWEPGTLLERLRGTAFAARFDSYLADYGQRGVGESDIMSPRFVDQPEVVLDVLRHQITAAAAASPADIAERQRLVRDQACRAIRARCGRRLDRWWIFQWWYRRLCRFYALREANRHHLMYYALATRQLLLRAGSLLVEQGVLDQADDVFFIRVDEQRSLLRGEPHDWRTLVRSRRAAREQDLRRTVPDRLVDGVEDVHLGDEPGTAGWRGVPISAGRAIGPVRILRSTEDWKKVNAGDILVAPVIDPGMAPLFGLAAGLVVEMGGTLSHGAIIAREYGLPAVANIAGITTWLSDGESVELDAAAGFVRRVTKSDQANPVSS